MKVSQNPIEEYNGQGNAPSTQKILLAMAEGEYVNNIDSRSDEVVLKQMNKTKDQWVLESKRYLRRQTALLKQYTALNKAIEGDNLEDLVGHDNHEKVFAVLDKQWGESHQIFKENVEEIKSKVSDLVEEQKNRTMEAKFIDLSNKINYKMKGVPVVEYYQQIQDTFSRMEGRRTAKKEDSEEEWLQHREEYMTVLFKVMESMTKTKEGKERIIDFVLKTGGLEQNLYYFGAGKKKGVTKDKYTQAAVNTLFNSGYQTLLKDMFNNEKDVKIQRERGDRKGEYINFDVYVFDKPRVRFKLRTHGTSSMKVGLPEFFDDEGTAQNVFALYGEGPSRPSLIEPVSTLPVELTKEKKPRKGKPAVKKTESTPQKIKAVDDPRYNDFVKAQGDRIEDMGTKREKEFISNAKKMSYDDLISKWVKPGSLKKV